MRERESLRVKLCDPSQHLTFPYMEENNCIIIVTIVTVHMCSNFRGHFIVYVLTYLFNFYKHIISEVVSEEGPSLFSYNVHYKSVLFIRNIEVR